MTLVGRAGSLAMALAAIFVMVSFVVASTSPAEAHGCHATAARGPSGWHWHQGKSCTAMRIRRAFVRDGALCRTACSGASPFRQCRVVCSKPHQSRYARQKRASPARNKVAEHAARQAVAPAAVTDAGAPVTVETSPVAPSPVPASPPAGVAQPPLTAAVPPVASAAPISTSAVPLVGLASPAQPAQSEQHPLLSLPPELMAPAAQPDCKPIGRGAAAPADGVPDPKVLAYERECYAAYERLTRHRLEQLQAFLKKSALASARSATQNGGRKQLDRGVFVGRKMELETTLGPISLLFKEDGSLEGRGTGEIAQLMGYSQLEGSWRIAEDKLCQKWAKLLGEAEICFTLDVREDVVHWVRDDGQRGVARLLP